MAAYTLRRIFWLVPVLLFISGYILLLVQLIMERWMNLGEHVGPAAWTALAAVVMNVVAVALLVRNSQPGPDMAKRHAQFRRTVQLFRESLSYLDTLNQMNWEARHHDDSEPPHTRYADSLLHLSDEELERLLRQVQARREDVVN